MSAIYEYKSIGGVCEFKDIDEKKGIITGYFASFDTLDSDGDVFMKGAFTKSVKERGPEGTKRIKHLFNHDPNQPLALILSLKEDNTGLLYESKTGTHTLGREFIKMAESGLITEHSVGFKTTKSKPTKEGREITEVKLYEGSSLSFLGANGNTPLLSVKSGLDLDLLIKKHEAIEKFCRSTDISDETIDLLLIHSKQLAQIIIDLKASNPVETSYPEKDVIETIKQFKNSLK